MESLETVRHARTGEMNELAVMTLMPAPWSEDPDGAPSITALGAWLVDRCRGNCAAAALVAMIATTSILFWIDALSRYELHRPLV